MSARLSRLRAMTMYLMWLTLIFSLLVSCTSLWCDRLLLTSMEFLGFLIMVVPFPELSVRMRRRTSGVIVGGLLG